MKAETWKYKAVQVRLTPEVIARLDRARGALSRASYLRGALLERLNNDPVLTTEYTVHHGRTSDEEEG